MQKGITVVTQGGLRCSATRTQSGTQANLGTGKAGTACHTRPGTAVLGVPCSTDGAD